MEGGDSCDPVISGPVTAVRADVDTHGESACPERTRPPTGSLELHRGMSEDRCGTARRAEGMSG